MTDKISKKFRIYITKTVIKGKLVTLVDTTSHKSLKMYQIRSKCDLKQFRN